MKKNFSIILLLVLFYFFLARFVFVNACCGGVSTDIYVKKVYKNASGQIVLTQNIKNAKISWFRTYLDNEGIKVWGAGTDLFTDANGRTSYFFNSCAGKIQLQLIPESIPNLGAGGHWETVIKKFPPTAYAALIPKNKYPDNEQYPDVPKAASFPNNLGIFSPDRRPEAVALCLNNPPQSNASELKGGLLLIGSNAGGTSEMTYTYYPPVPTPTPIPTSTPTPSPTPTPTKTPTPTPTKAFPTPLTGVPTNAPARNQTNNNKQYTWMCLKAEHTANSGSGEVSLSAAAGFPSNQNIYLAGCIDVSGQFKCTTGTAGGNSLLGLSNISGYDFHVVSSSTSNPFTLPTGTSSFSGKKAISKSNLVTKHVFYGVFEGIGVGPTGNATSLQYGTFGFGSATVTKCVTIRWDPYGKVFDAKTLKPIPNVIVALLDQNRELVQMPGLINPIATNQDGYYNFWVEPGTYYIEVISPKGYNFQKNPNFNQKIIEKEESLQINIPLTSTYR
jgi:hypothetical protein